MYKQCMYQQIGPSLDGRGLEPQTVAEVVVEVGHMHIWLQVKQQ